MVQADQLDNLFMDLDDKALAKAAARYDNRDLDDVSSPNVMLAYYQRLFPFKKLFLWLNHDQTPSRQWTHREFAFTLQNDAYLRYNSFSTAEDLKKEVLRLNPSRFEIGPVYSARPKDKKTLNKATFKPLLRELVFDVDMTDYDAVRTCCSDKSICRRCWAFITMAARVVDCILREDFGFRHLLWVYSGRRGIHCWVSDKSAMSLNDDQRRSIVNYIDVVKGGAKQEKKVSLPRPLHPSLRRSLETLEPYFIRTILEDQDCFRSQAQAEALLAIMPTDGPFVQLRADWAKENWSGSSVKKYKEVRQAVLNAQATKNKSKAQTKGADALDDMRLQYTYPRIDIEVSKHLNHLLKSPFCIHPSTGRVCVPLASLDDIENFRPEDVPTVGVLLRELEGLKLNSGNIADGWERTSLKKYVDVFDRHCEGLLRETRETKKAAGTARSMEF